MGDSPRILCLSLAAAILREIEWPERNQGSRPSSFRDCLCGVFCHIPECPLKPGYLRFFQQYRQQRASLSSLISLIRQLIGNSLIAQVFFYCQPIHFSDDWGFGRVKFPVSDDLVPFDIFNYSETIRRPAHMNSFPIAVPIFALTLSEFLLLSAPALHALPAAQFLR